ncbi:DNA-3-methyladenine glycosylase 2 family protein [Actinophytocola sp.]|uniref:DNA-3-methyladenine glycosylase family protein n=1 Tax=Actinophytocola sp. TaxID=1872138 RepID=UPI002D7E9F0A|nr:DNA-3-methyladenine glycosylase 2 family protein [Actinophytocola sp.]HET9143652.1 DNA-3-methyladenine glycosylase 2 family protein [Actinophytocola sp.]
MKTANETKLAVSGPFDLAASARFLEGFTPASRPDAAGRPGELRFAFPAAPSWRPVGVVARQRGPDEPVCLRVAGDPSDVDAAVRHARRILSLDVDGSGFAEVGRRDPVVAELQRRYPGLRPVAFHSPYEAACWTIIGHRIRIVQAAAIKDQLARRLGTMVDVEGVELPAFPGPETLAALDRVPLVNEVKSDRLRGVARAALAGELDPDTLRAMPVEAALARLRRIPGIGPFSAELTLLRGAAHPDGFPTAERRLHEEMAAAYHTDDPADLSRIAHTWRPYRTWVAVLFRTRREMQTGEISGRHPERVPAAST